jgi:hypothetical protein
MRWGAELAERWGATRVYGFHLVVWGHDEECPLNLATNTLHWLSSGCQCQPDGTLVLHVGCADERRVPVVRDGEPLPVRPVLG